MQRAGRLDRVLVLIVGRDENLKCLVARQAVVIVAACASPENDAFEPERLSGLLGSNGSALAKGLDFTLKRVVACLGAAKLLDSLAELGIAGAELVLHQVPVSATSQGKKETNPA